jgi:MFS family permease
MDAEALQRRTLRVLVASQVLAGAGLAAGHHRRCAPGRGHARLQGQRGRPLGAADARVGDRRRPRRPAVAALGTPSRPGGGVRGRGARRAGVVLAAAVDSVPLLFVALVLYGSGAATNLQGRYAGADLVAPDRRGRAISIVLVATTAGAVIGPNLVDATGTFARGLGITALAGPFMLATVAYAAAAVAILVLLRPDPLLAARRFAVDATAAAAARGDAPVVDAPGDPATVRLAATTMILTTTVMVAIMTMTPVHMRDHDHGLGAVGIVISLHVAAMFLPSPLTGIVVDRAGRRPVIAAGGLVLLAAAVVAAPPLQSRRSGLAVALILLGLGWNFGLIGGTALLTDATPAGLAGADPGDRRSRRGAGRRRRRSRQRAGRGLGGLRDAVARRRRPRARPRAADAPAPRTRPGAPRTLVADA